MTYHILFIAHQDSYKGGSNRSLLTLIKSLPANLIPYVIVPAQGELSEKLSQENIPFDIVPHKTWIDYRSRPIRATLRWWINHLLAHFYKFRTKQTVDLIYTNTLYSPFGAILASQLKIPHLWHAREFINEDMGAEYDLGTQKAMQFISNFSDQIICNSHAVNSKMSRYIADDKLSVVYNAVQQSPQLLKKHSSIIRQDKVINLCIIGKISPHKGQIDAIKALAYLRGYDVRLNIAGTGKADYINELKTLAESLAVQSQIIWHGFIEIEPFLATMDISLVCSRSEAFGRVVVESMIAVCPVIGANSGGIPELIQDEQTGLLYEHGQEEQLASQIKKLIQTPSLYKHISTQALIYAKEQFTVKIYADKISGLIMKSVSHT